MKKFDEARVKIDSKIKENGSQSITGKVLNEVLNAIVDSTEDVLETSEIETIPNKIDKEADDYYPKMAVGVADNLAGVDVVESEFTFRRSGGGAITDGVARIEAIKGNSVVWNQLIQRTYKTRTHNGITFTVNEDGSVVANGTATAFAYLAVKSISVYSARKYCVIGGVDNASPTTYYFGDGNNLNLFNNKYIIANPINNATITFACRVMQGVTVENVKFDVPKVFDLTQMFGAGKEPTTIEEFYARIPMGVDMNAYNEGEVIHMNVQSLKSVGRNAWDEKWRVGAYVSTTGAYYGGSTNKLCNRNPIAVLSNTQYYVSNDIVNEVYFYDENNNYISSEYIQYLKKFTTPANARYVNYNTANLSVVEYNNDICINLFDSAFNGKYEPYIERSEDLSIVRKYFPDGMKSAGTAHDEIRYNKASGKWEKVEAIGVRAYQKGDADNASYLTDGKVTCYPLAEPIVTELDAEDQFKDLDYQVWDGGTEKAISEGKSAPLAASITYGFNAVGLIKQLRTLVEAMQAKLADL